MSDARRVLLDRYATALASYVLQPGPAALAEAEAIGRAAAEAGLSGLESEAALNEAYELGRAAVQAGLGVLEMSALHHDALQQLDGLQSPTEGKQRALRAGHFLAEGLSAFEIMLRGYRETNVRLQAVNEALAEARDAAEAASRAKGMFVATVSHEIRTPMNGVLGMIEVLAHTPLNADQTDAVKTIRDSAHALLHLVDEILDFSRIEAKRMELERVPVEVGVMVEGICASLATLAHDKGVDLYPFVDPALPEWIWGDPTRLRQILSNLIGNAIKFSSGQPRRGRVAVRMSAVDKELCITVSDNGIGMSAATVAGLFITPFTQAEATTTRRFGGTGLGLVICKRLTDLMQGSIRADSAVGSGTTMTVRLALEPAGGSPRHFCELNDIDCIVVESAGLADADLRAYLEAAGASVCVVPDLAVAAQRGAGRLLATLIQAAGPDPARTAANALQHCPSLGHVLINRSMHTPEAIAGVIQLSGAALRRGALLRAVAATLGLASPEVTHEAGWSDLAGIVAQAVTVAEARAAGRLILLAEDDETNRKVILRQLDLLGYAAEVGCDGRQALALWRQGEYALLLTDLHMPDMDGYTLAATIRREEAEGRHMPILALTANAQREEINRVLALGMDEYLTKPIPLKLLQQTLVRWLPPVQATTPLPEVPMLVTDGAAALDLAVLKNLVGDNVPVLIDLLHDFQLSLQGLAPEILAAGEQRDFRGLKMLAHTLKSPARSFGALALGNLCQDLESATADSLPPLLLGFKDAVEAVAEAVTAQLAVLEA